MSFGLIVGIALAVLGGLLILAWQIPEAIEKEKKKRLRAVPPPPPKEWQAIAERFEKRVKLMEAEAQTFQVQLREKDKQSAQVSASLAGMKKQLDQEKAWREKEEAEMQKEKRQERALQEDLLRTRQALNSESTEKIKLEHELKSLRQAREELSGTGRGLATRVLELERQQESSLKELRQLREENARLSKKKEDTEWVAKSDYKQLEAQAKRTRFEVEEFRKAFPPSEWPASLKNQ
ncbi:MAG: hypothetical protein HQL20_04560 [Candidatus Omnitrophica bacterium]|nr:hypothetical protein [Candidatus Omnitrophota bacterium]